jgi:hypothetical protein
MSTELPSGVLPLASIAQWGSPGMRWPGGAPEQQQAPPRNAAGLPRHAADPLPGPPRTACPCCPLPCTRAQVRNAHAHSANATVRWENTLGSSMQECAGCQLRTAISKYWNGTRLDFRIQHKRELGIGQSWQSVSGTTWRMVFALCKALQWCRLPQHLVYAPGVCNLKNNAELSVRSARSQQTGRATHAACSALLLGSL